MKKRWIGIMTLLALLMSMAPVSFAENVAVTVHGGVELKAPGTYPIFTAESYDGLDFASWTLQVDNPVRGRSYSLELKDGAICLKVTAGGAILIVR